MVVAVVAVAVQVLKVERERNCNCVCLWNRLNKGQITICDLIPSHAGLFPGWKLLRTDSDERLVRVVIG